MPLKYIINNKECILLGENFIKSICNLRKPSSTKQLNEVKYWEKKQNCTNIIKLIREGHQRWLMFELRFVNRESVRSKVSQRIAKSSGLELWAWMSKTTNRIMTCVSGLKWAVRMWSYVFAQRSGQKSYYPWPTRWGKDVEFYLMKSESTEQSLPRQWRQWRCRSFMKSPLATLWVTDWRR